jgi:hypothetical protein
LSTGTIPSDLDTDSINDGGSYPGASANHLYVFTFPTTGNIGSIEFKYCTTAAGTCTTPTGLDTTTSNVSLGAQDPTVNGFTLNKTTNGAPYITRTAASATSASVTYRLDNITNPTTANQSWYVRITTYTGAALGGTAVDAGAVAASTANKIRLQGTMPESLIFCTGATVPLTGGGLPDCPSATTGTILFDDLFSTSFTRFATSQMAASTNAVSGYSITLRGPTMTSGANTIAPIGGSATASTIGISQFGVNLMDNATPDVGSAITPTSNGTNYRANPAANYGTADQYAFQANTNLTVANSDQGGGGAGPSDNQRYTSAYIVNVAGSQAAGTYTTTLTYICTATF